MALIQRYLCHNQSLSDCLRLKTLLFLKQTAGFEGYQVLELDWKIHQRLYIVHYELSSPIMGSFFLNKAHYYFQSSKDKSSKPETYDARMNIPGVVSGPELNLRYVLLSNIKIEIAYLTGRGDCTSLKADSIGILNIINV